MENKTEMESRHVKMFTPVTDYHNHQEEYQENMNAVLEKGNFIMGEEVRQLEEKLEGYLSVKHAIAVSSGTDALLIALLALGVGVGDEVITTPFTWISTAEVIELLGAKTVFVDIEDETYNIDPSKIEMAITERTKAIIPVCLYGQAPNMIAINRIAGKYNIPVIEDAAQSFGSTQNGEYSGTLSEIGCTSFFPTKPLGCYGDGGACFTNDDELAKKMKAIRVHGGVKRFDHQYVGINGRLDTLQASILLVKMKYFSNAMEARQLHARIYNDAFRDCDWITTPVVAENNTHVYGQYTIRVSQETRDKLRAYLKERGVGTGVFYAVPIHHQPIFGKCPVDMPLSDRVALEVLSLPCYPELTEEDIEYVSRTILEFYQD